MKKSKKITALILAAMLAVSSSAAMAVTVSAEEDTAVAYSSSDTKSWGDYDYQVLDDGTVEIMHYKGSDNNLVIPSEIDGKKVTSIGDLYSNKDIISVEIPNSVTSIGGLAFYDCTNLTEVKIPNSVTSIGARAFENCTSLTNIEIPDSVTSIGGSAFYGCTNLTEVKIPNSVTSIGNLAFKNCTSLTEVKIPNSVTYIGSEAFKDCNNLTIYGYVGSTAETYAKENNIPFVDINSKVLTSKVNNISVKGAFDDSVTLNVEEATVKNAVKAYNITLKDENGNTIQPNGKITVSIPSDNANCKVYWIKEDGTKVDMNATYNNGNYEFTTDHLSVYALIADTTEPSQESSGEQNNSSSESSGEQSNNPSEPSNNTNSSKTTSETGKNAVNTGDNNTTAIAAIFAVGALIAAIIMRKKKA